MTHNIVVIPARGGSKGIPRKNLRPLNGFPLIHYAIAAAREVPEVASVIVSTDDDEIALFAERFGARVQMRPPDSAGDTVPLDPVILNALECYERDTGAGVRWVISIQPTSPLIEPRDLRLAIAKLESGAGSVISVVEDKHLTWTRDPSGFVPEYRARVNRQQLPDRFRETGAVIACAAADLRARGTRIVPPVDLLLMPPERSVDIDSYQDLAVAEFLLRRKRIDFVVVGNRALGLGHAVRALMIGHELVDHECRFWCPCDSALAAELIRGHNFPVETYAEEADLLEAMAAEPPDMVINDRLDTSADYVISLKKLGCKVVNFEDLGHGAEVADLVINALYPHQLPLPHVRVGAAYFCLRDEFLHGVGADLGRCPEQARRILVTFGGTDENNLTLRVIEVLCAAELGDIAIDVVLGPGYAHRAALEARVGVLRAAGAEIEVNGATSRISEHMVAADLGFSSAGRTVFELASVGLPSIVLCQNPREATHSFASAQHGFVNLGLARDVSDDELRATAVRLISSQGLRREMKRKMDQVDLRRGKSRVTGEILDLIGARER